MMSVNSQERCPFNADFNGGNHQKSAVASSGKYGGYSNVVTLFFAKKSLTKTD